MKKYYFKVKYSRKTRIKRIMFGICLSVLLPCSYLVLKYGYLFIITLPLNKILSIDDIKIEKNFTTLPNEIIIDKLQKRQVTLLNVTSRLKEIIYTFPEIKNIKMKYQLPKKISLMIFCETPIFYSVSSFPKKNIYYTITGKRFWLYDERSYKNKIIKFTSQNSEYEEQIHGVTKLFSYLYETENIGYINEIIFDKNKYILVMNNSKRILLDKKIDTIDTKRLDKTIRLCYANNVDIDARLLSDGKIYLMSNTLQKFN